MPLPQHLAVIAPEDYVPPKQAPGPVTIELAPARSRSSASLVLTTSSAIGKESSTTWLDPAANEDILVTTFGMTLGAALRGGYGALVGGGVALAWSRWRRNHR